jgi:1A family penicillin-binding protein
MPETPNNSPQDVEADGQPPHDWASRAEPSRTRAAGRAFVAALASDIGMQTRRLRRRFFSAGQGRAQATVSSGGTHPALGAGARFRRVLVKGLAVIVLLGLVTFGGAMLWALDDLPAEKPIGGSGAPSLLLEAANGEALGRVGLLKMPDATRADFPDVLVNAVISIEDRHFYSHWGFDLGGIIRAFRRNTEAGTIVEGGSTITQQLVKMRFLGHERTMPRKLREALVATWLDARLGKDEILTRYLNSVYLGNGAYGMAAAARLYFDKRVSDLTLPEAAVLAGTIRAPSRDNPLQNPDGARARTDVVIDAMRDNGILDAATAEDAKAHPAVLHLSRQALRAGTWFADWIARQAAEVPGSFSGHVRLRTTLVPELQKLAEQSVGDVLARDGAERRVSQAALVAMRPDGSVVAMVGGRNYGASQFNRAVDALRQPGSSFKLFVYLAALRKGRSLDDTIDAEPLEINGWEPENYGERHFGRVTLVQAFAQSINTAAVRLAQEVGLNDVIAAARDLGISSDLPAVPSLALGVAGVNLLDLTAAYASVQAGKMPIRPWGIAGFGVEGEPRLQSMGPPIGETRSLQPYQKPLLALLQAVVQRGTGRAAALDGYSAGKTGTSQNYRDAWFIGFNDALIVGVWVGNDDGTPTEHVTGGSLPAAIWKRFMTGSASVVARGELPAIAAPPAESTPAVPAVSQTSPAQCDYQACARTYSSFRASDCTYQPYDGSSRRLCEKNAPQRTAAAPLAPNSDSQASPAGKACKIDVCASFYSSFDAATCTYQPYDGGPRRICDR